MEDFGTDLLNRFEMLRIRFQKNRFTPTESEELCKEVSTLMPDLLNWEQFHLGDYYIFLTWIFIWISRSVNTVNP